MMATRAVRFAAMWGIGVAIVTGAAAQAPKSPLPDGDGRLAVVENCGGCHDTNAVVAKRKTVKDWDAVIADMREKGSPASDDDAKAALGYLARHFGTVNVNTASAGELQKVLGISADEAKAVVSHRESLGPFKTLDDLKNAPGLEAKLVENNKDSIVFGEEKRRP